MPFSPNGGMPLFDLRDILYKVAILFGILIVMYGVFWLLTELGLIPKILFTIVPQIALIVIGLFIIVFAYSKRNK